MFTLLILLCIIFIFLLIVLFMLLRYQIQKQRQSQRSSSDGQTQSKKIVIGFFHPYCNAGGGGERVLWVAVRAMQKSNYRQADIMPEDCDRVLPSILSCGSGRERVLWVAVRAMQKRYPNIHCVIYTGDIDASQQEILNKARQRFNISLPKPVEFVFLKSRNWVEAKKYPIFTLLGQSLGSLILGWEALRSYVPDIYIDTMGYAFTVPLFRYLGKCKVACYIHYPTISTDMLQRVSRREENFNNAGFVSQSSVLTNFKLIYYKFFAYLYGLVGKRSNIVMVNSTWTYNHIKSLWKVPLKTVIVYPSCDVSEFVNIPLTDKGGNQCQMILSIAQFRPEKNHRLQIESFSKFLEQFSDKEKLGYKLILAGGCRDSKDAARVEELKQLTEKLAIQKYVEFRLNISFDELKSLMSEATIGLHTMRDEHFGIGVVELMAAGTVILANDSGGPKMDIVVPHDGQPTGYLASDVDTFSSSMTTIFNLSGEERLAIRRNARKSVSRFSDEEFENSFMNAVEPLLKSL